MKWIHYLLSVFMISTTGCGAIKPAHDLSVGEGFINPIGFHDATPTFSWKLPTGVIKQNAYAIEVTQDGQPLWESDWVTSDQSVFVPYKGSPLQSRDQIDWRVRYRDEKGQESPWSEPARCELGLLNADDWQAQWIRPVDTPDMKQEPVCWLRRSFDASKAVQQARLYVTARGMYQIHLNESKVNHDHFANGWTTYAKRLDTLTYDVTQQLQTGDNHLQVALGTGWYAGRLSFVEWNPQPTELLLQLEIAYEDGTAETIVSDDQWQGTWTGPITSSSIYDGEIYDARQPITNWGPVVANADLGKARLHPKPFPPVRANHTLATQKITEPQPGRHVFDLGQNMVGWARVQIPVCKDQTVTLRFAEMLNQDGTLYTANYRGAKSTDTYTPAIDGTITWEPHFTFHGFRYVELSGLSDDVTPQSDWVTGIVLHSDLHPIGTFTSSHAMLNQLQSNIVWGQRGNFVDIPTDCPQRDERMGWTGDAQVFCPTSMFNYDCLSFWKSWLETMRDDQEPDGSVPEVIPRLMLWRKSPGWMDAATIVPWEVYVRSGDIDVLVENYSLMEGLVRFYRSQATDGLIPQANAYGDWLQPYAQRTEGDTPAPLLATAFYANSTQLLARAAEVLGRHQDAQRYTAEATHIKQAFTRHYFDADSKLQNSPETQTAYLLALAFDLVPADRRQAITEHLVRLVHEADNHLRTGFLGTPYLIPMLDRMGHADLACQVLFTETYPSWFFSINQGATTLWERWNSYSHQDGFGDAGMNSFNHYAYGAIGQWMTERLAGLAPDPAQPGYQHFLIQPLICQQLDSARAQLETPYGLASSSWNRQYGKITLEVTVPPNSSATITFPDKRPSLTVDAGHYRYELGMD